jgi:DNA-binding GntR family transcriptional regulator
VASKPETLTDERAVGAVNSATAAIRNLVLRRVLVPGQQVRQEDLAQEIGMSRGPLREALRVLEAEGVVRHVPNRGYFVTQYTAEEMKQIYLIRDLLESKILGSLPRATSGHLDELRAINDRIRADGLTLLDVINLNREFHDLLMSRSTLHLLVSTISQVGRMSIAYQALSLNFLPTWNQIADDHEAMISALDQYDLESLVGSARIHRDRTLDYLLPVLV